MKILGIETSCDETAAAVVENGTLVLSNVIASQIPLHQLTGGVVPEVAAREHVVKIMPVIEKALYEAKITLGSVDAIAVTQGPGLASSLVIGIAAASTLALAIEKPLIPVHHIGGHIYANWLEEVPSDAIQFPVAVLTVSGGHNELVYMKAHTRFRLLGETLDDAAGEAFDKVARLLGLGYPGGPQISRCSRNGNNQRFTFPRAYLDEKSYDFSFSGLKTAVFNAVRQEHEEKGCLSEQFIADCAASFQEAVCQILSDKLLRAAMEYQVREVHLAGGVSANLRLREVVQNKITEGCFFDHKRKRIAFDLQPKFRYPRDISYCTDNAAMIAASAFFHFQKNPEKYLQIIFPKAYPNIQMYKL